MRHMRCRTTLTAFALTLPLAAACTGGDPDAAPGTDRGSPATSPQRVVGTIVDTVGEPSGSLATEPQPATTAGADAATDRPANTAPTASVPQFASSPLSQYLAGPATGSDDLGAQFERWQRAFESEMAVCMGEQGFEYAPYVVPIQITVVDGGAMQLGDAAGPLPGADLAPDEFAAQYGYGISTIDPADRSTINPNDTIVDDMDVAARVAYHQAMYGASQSLDANGYPDSEIAGDDGSCYARSVARAEDLEGDEVAPELRAQVDASFEGLLEQVAALADQALSDPRVVAAESAWSECMADAGYPGYTDLNGPQTDMAARARSLLGDALDPRNADPAELAALQRDEIAVAVADQACRVGLGSVHEDVTRELEQRFVEDHRAELEEYRDALAALGA